MEKIIQENWTCRTTFVTEVFHKGKKIILVLYLSNLRYILKATYALEYTRLLSFRDTVMWGFYAPYFNLWKKAVINKTVFE